MREGEGGREGDGGKARKARKEANVLLCAASTAGAFLLLSRCPWACPSVAPAALLALTTVARLSLLSELIPWHSSRAATKKKRALKD